MLGAICVALGIFCVGPMVIDQQLVNIALNMSPEKTAVMILSAAGVVLFQRGIAGFIVLMLGSWSLGQRVSCTTLWMRLRRWGRSAFLSSCLG